MIDEKRVLEEIADFKRCQKSENCDYLTGYISALSAVEGMIAEQPKVGDWIPCSEGLPEEDKNNEYYDSLIVTLDDGRVACGCYINRDKEWWVDAEDGEKCSINATGRVVAWMPLPPAYKEEVNQ